MSFGVLPIQGNDPVKAAKAVTPAAQRRVSIFEEAPDGTISLKPKLVK